MSRSRNPIAAASLTFSLIFLFSLTTGCQSSSPPVTSKTKPVTSKIKYVSRIRNVRLFTTPFSKWQTYGIENNNECWITAYFDLKPRLLKTSKSLPITVIVPPKGRATVCRVYYGDVNQKVKYFWNFAYGKFNCKHDGGYSYALPYPKGTVRRVSQGFIGSTHKGMDANAIDWLMPVGSPVCAARGGKVIYIKEDSSEGGLGEKYFKSANMVSILHDDGTIGNYAHLKKNGVIPRLNQTVQRGELIAYSGNTGQSGGPHLHFDVSTPLTKETYKRFKIRFTTEDGENQYLEAHRAYKAP